MAKVEVSDLTWAHADNDRWVCLRSTTGEPRPIGSVQRYGGANRFSTWHTQTTVDEAGGMADDGYTAMAPAEDAPADA